MLRSFAFALLRSFSELNCSAHLNQKPFVVLQKSAEIAKYLHVSSLRFADTPDDGDIEKTIKKAVESVTKKDEEALLLEPHKLRLRKDQRHMNIREAIKEHKIYAASEEGGGTIGAKSLLSMNTSEVDRHLPGSMTVAQEFDGVLYRELPVAYIKASSNNTIIQVTNILSNKVILYTSARKEGFKHTKKKSPLAGQTTGTAAGQKLLRRGVSTVRVVIKGIGPGRITSVKGLAAAGIRVVSISDRTPIPELGPRPKKIRRV